MPALGEGGKIIETNAKPVLAKQGASAKKEADDSQFMLHEAEQGHQDLTEQLRESYISYNSVAMKT